MNGPQTVRRRGDIRETLAGVALDRMLAGAGDGVSVVSADGRILGWNRAAERILGYTAREAIGRLCCDVFSGRDDDDNRLCYPGCHVQALARMGETIHSFDMQSRTKTGQVLWLNVSVLAGDGTPAGPTMVHLFRDVTATKEMLLLVNERRPSGSPGPALSAGDSPLTRREVEVLRLLASGAGTRRAAEALHVSPATVRNHVQNILGKLGVHSRLEAVAYANRHRLL